MPRAVKGKDFMCITSFSPHHIPEPFSFNRQKKLGCLEVKCFAQRTAARKGKSQDSNLGLCDPQAQAFNQNLYCCSRR